ncbi:dihydrofolate reductase family protein [candidate division KSB1 bacterium]|nr:dihydrofolate reductase family protein [candidate division KSB1 bacterium]
MRKVVSHLIMTLDGVVNFEVVMERIVKLRDTEEVLQDFFAKVAQEDAMLLGRVTYQQWAGYWPASINEPFASHINNVPKYVVSNTLDSVPWGTQGNATLIKGNFAEALADLKQQAGKNIGIHGSPTLVESLLQAELLDELRLEIYPVVAGSGARMFHDGRAVKHLQLADAKITKNGVAILTYQPMKSSTGV